MAFLEMIALADKGDAAAQNNVGLMYGFGYGVEKDCVAARKWHRKAADQGDASAQLSLGLIYAGGKCVKQNYVEAYAWYNLAIGTEAYAQRLRDSLGSRMSPKQVSKALKRTKELRAQIEAKAKVKVASLPALPLAPKKKTPRPDRKVGG